MSRRRNIRSKKVRYILFKIIPSFILALVASSIVIIGYFIYDTPPIDDLDNIKLQEPLRVYTRDDVLIAEYGVYRRTPIKYDDIPDKMKLAFLAAEDSRFYEHSGIDFFGLTRAALQLISSGSYQSGGSTITMQLARNYFLTNRKELTRKIREIILAVKIELTYPKNKIFELYVNKIFFGYRSYGIQAASQFYFGKNISDLTLGQMASLASIPKAPSYINPYSNPARNIERRNWILKRMLDLGYIEPLEYSSARLESLNSIVDSKNFGYNASYATEIVRTGIINDPQKYIGQDSISEQELYEKGYKVYTTLDSGSQKSAQISVLRGLLSYDYRETYRGPEDRVVDFDPSAPDEEIFGILEQHLSDKDFDAITDHGLRPAIVSNVTDDIVEVLLVNGQSIMIDRDGVRWRLNQDQSIQDIFTIGDIVRVIDWDGVWLLSQMPEVQSSLISIKSRTGEIISLIGGFSYEQSKFNRATQAKRQIGSTIKPFIVASALENGFTAATVFNDAPFIEREGSNDIWRPKNDGGTFLGPITLRRAIVLSRNLVSVRVVDQIGLQQTKSYLSSIGSDEEALPDDLSLSLGSGSISPIKLASLYALFANGGYEIEPYLITRIEDADGNILYRRNPIEVCDICTNPEGIEPVMDSSVSFIIDSILKDVILRGTGARARVLNRPDLGGKTGTTNESVDNWFAGYSPELVTVTWFGFDEFKPVSGGVFGSNTALPIWVDFMKVALPRISPVPINRQIPENIINLNVDPETFSIVLDEDESGIEEYFILGTEPKELKIESFKTEQIEGAGEITAPEQIF